MSDTAENLCIDIDEMPPAGKECRVKTSKGLISVFVCGDQTKPALITYPDVALNYMSCFRGLFLCQDAASLLLDNFCIYHIDAPGHELGADVISSDMPLLSVDDLADQVAEVLNFFGLDKVFCLGVTAGAYILTLFAMRHSKRVHAVILVSPICQAPSWTEWIYNKVLLNLLYFYGMCGLLKKFLLQRYFSKEVRCGIHDAESDVMHICRRLLDEMQSLNVMRFLQAINQRHDLTKGLRKLQCRTLIFVGECSPFYADSLHMNSVMDKKISGLVELPSATRKIHHMLLHLHLQYTNCHNHSKCHVLAGQVMWLPGDRRASLRDVGTNRILLDGVYRQISSDSSSSDKSRPIKPSNASCITPELLSPESLGVKLKPIKTRAILKA